MDLKNIHPSLILINSPQGGGKSHLIRYMMYEMRHLFDYGIVFTNTYFEDDSFDYLNKKYVHPEYDPKTLSNLMNLQKRIINEGGSKNAFVIFDDCIDSSQFKCPKLKQLCTQLRHYNITVIFATQYANILPTYMRSNSMITIIFKTDAECNLKALYASYGQLFNNYNEFKNFIMQNLGNHKFIYYNKKKSNDNIDDTYKIMICPENIPKFHFKIKI